MCINPLVFPAPTLLAEDHCGRSALGSHSDAETAKNKADRQSAEPSSGGCTLAAARGHAGHSREDTTRPACPDLTPKARLSVRDGGTEFYFSFTCVTMKQSDQLCRRKHGLFSHRREFPLFS